MYILSSKFDRKNKVDPTNKCTLMNKKNINCSVRVRAST